ncbi:DUF6534 domain-containing protein [Sporobolomyces salmoneus]|uniref:DUF6534 domain-containing protein n=1 Tax=Sporobolomyces salmoneus TaxID=183962 RepID=UPI00316EABBC
MADYQDVGNRPCIAGYQVQFMLFGVLIRQTISYFEDSKSHSRLSKWTAAVVVGLNVIYTAICFEDGYNLAASSDRTVITLFNGSLAWQFLPLLNGLIAATAEAFLTFRAGAFFLNKKAKIAFYVWQSALIVLVFFGSIASFVEGVIGFYDPYTEEAIPYNTAVSIWLWACAAADCSISLALAYNLHQRIAHFNAATDSTLRKLILIGLRTAAFTAILSVVGAVMSSIYSGWDESKADLPIAFWIPTGALYGISLFTTLSSTRQVVEKRLQPSIPTLDNKSHQHPPLPMRRSISTVSNGLLHITNRHRALDQRHQVIPLEINVTKEVVRNVDREGGLEEDEEKSDSGFVGSFERKEEYPPRGDV